MNKQKNSRKTLNEIGKSEFNFDYELQKIIYKYLCHLRLSKKEVKKLKEELKFDSHKNWKEYIENIYNKYEVDQLIEFSWYLNQGMRSTKPVSEYWKLLIPLITALFLPKGMDLLFMIEKMYITNPGIGAATVLIVYLLIFACLVIWVSWKIVAPIIDRYIEENFFTDYKEIVDGIISEKNKLVVDSKII